MIQLQKQMRKKQQIKKFSILFEIGKCLGLLEKQTWRGLCIAGKLT
jgi:hypothetical protein